MNNSTKSTLSYDGMRTAANNIMGNKDKMNTILTDTKTKMSSIEQVWSSDAEREVKAEFDSMAAKFQGFIDAVNEYSKFITQSANAYEEADKQLKQIATQKLAK